VYFCVRECPARLTNNNRQQDENTLSVIEQQPRLQIRQEQVPPAMRRPKQLQELEFQEARDDSSGNDDDDDVEQWKKRQKSHQVLLHRYVCVSSGLSYMLNLAFLALIITGTMCPKQPPPAAVDVVLFPQGGNDSQHQQKLTTITTSDVIGGSSSMATVVTKENAVDVFRTFLLNPPVPAKVPYPERVQKGTHFSQVGQDEAIDAILRQETNGFFIEVGAYDGTYDVQTVTCMCSFTPISPSSNTFLK
jgi:hypothetical protein